MMLRLRRILVVCLLASLLLVTSCSKAPSQFSQAQKESTARGAGAVVKDSVTGGTLNKYFPSSGGGYDRVFVQEKKGFAEAKLKKGATELAVMSISDTLNNPTATAKFKDSQETIKGFPSVQQGTTGTAILVNDRYQVKVLSRSPSFTEKDRQTWLAKFDLAGLSKLKAQADSTSVGAKKAPSFFPSPQPKAEVPDRKVPSFFPSPKEQPDVTAKQAPSFFKPSKDKAEVSEKKAPAFPFSFIKEKADVTLKQPAGAVAN